MTTWKLILTYDGGPFHGWQVQPRLPTVQGTLAEALRHLTGESVLPHGSGRTDAGVHALAQVASFSLSAPLPAGNLQRALNRALPPSIRVLSAEPVSKDFHARHSAVRKTYEYRLFERVPGHPGATGGEAVAEAERLCSPFVARYAWDCQWPLDVAAMQAATESCLGTHDFTSFAAADPDRHERRASEAAKTVNPVKTIFALTVVREDSLLVFRITGSGFLHHMVRNLVGTLVEVGRGRLASNAMPGILLARSRAAAGPTAPPCGLFLVSVEYPAEPVRVGSAPEITA